MSKKTKETILMQKHSQRDAFWSRVAEMMKEDQDIVIVVADMSTPVFDKVRRMFPDRFFNVGIAEQNAILIGSGLAIQGKKVFVYAIASFMVLRCYEQIRVSNSMMGIPITIVGVGAGFSYDDSGPTHHLFEDIALFRMLPNFQTYSVSDNVMAKNIAEVSAGLDKPNYVRLERHVEPDLYEDESDFSQGYSVLKKGDQGCIVATGIMVRQALEIRENLKENAISLGVVDIHRIPCDSTLVTECLTKESLIISLEEHRLEGGIGSYLMEMLSDHNILKIVRRFGVSNGWCYRYGGREDNRAFHGIDQKSLIKEIKNFFE